MTLCIFCENVPVLPPFDTCRACYDANFRENSTYSTVAVGDTPVAVPATASQAPTPGPVIIYTPHTNTPFVADGAGLTLNERMNAVRAAVAAGRTLTRDERDALIAQIKIVDVNTKSMNRLVSSIAHVPGHRDRYFLNEDDAATVLDDVRASEIALQRLLDVIFPPV